MQLHDVTLTEQTAERDGGRERREVDEDEDADALHVQPVLDVGHVEREALLDVFDHAAERPARARQRVLGRLGLGLHLFCHRQFLCDVIERTYIYTGCA